MRTETRQETSVAVLTPIHARVDAHVAPAFRTALLACIDQGHHDLMVDMNRVEFSDSAGLDAHVSAPKRLGHDGDLKICSLNVAVRSMFELTRLNRVMRIAD
jgi:anti-sigma B factor antagonist